MYRDIRLKRKFSAASVAFGVAAGTFCNWATQIKFIFGWDDTLDVRPDFSCRRKLQLIRYI
jgi:hypothetical protein